MTAIVVIEATDGPDVPGAAAAWIAARSAELARSCPVTVYRKLNHSSALLLADSAGNAGVADLTNPCLPPGASTRSFTARESSRRRRDDVPDDPDSFPLLYIVAFSVPSQEAGQRLDDWYDNEHMEMLQRCPTWVMTRRVHLAVPAAKDWGTHLALHYLADIGALTSLEADIARTTPWRRKLGQEAWCRSTGRIYLRERLQPRS